MNFPDHGFDTLYGIDRPGQSPQKQILEGRSSYGTWHKQHFHYAFLIILLEKSSLSSGSNAGISLGGAGR